MQTRVDEVAERVYRRSPYVSPPGSTFNHLIDAEEPPVSTTGDIIGPALATEKRFTLVPLTPDTGPSLRRLAGLTPRVVGPMHGPAFTGSCTPALEAPAGHDDTGLCRALSSIDECR